MVTTVTRITTILFFSFLFSVSSAYCQLNADNTPSNGCVVLRIDYCSNWLITSYGNNKKTEVKLNRSKQLPIQDQIGDLNNILADALNKLKEEGYTVVSSVSDVNDGNTCGLTFILCKNQ